MKRRLLIILSALSLLLFVAVCVLWVRSVAYSTDMLINADKTAARDGYFHTILFRSESGYVWGVTMRDRWGIHTERGYSWRWSRAAPGRPHWLGHPERRGVFAAGYFQPTVPIQGEYVSDEHYWWVHCSSLALLTGALPVSFVWHRLRQRGASRGGSLCASCGYDLRATPERCPECGAASAKAGT